MEKLNLNFGSSENILKSIFWLLSYLSWILLTINSWASLKWLYNEKSMTIWTLSIINDYDLHSYRPLQMYFIFIYIVFHLSIVIILFGCIFFFFKTLIRKDEQIKNILMNKYTQYHFFPLLCAFIMFILGEAPNETERNMKDIYRTGLAISLIGLGSMIFIYIMSQPVNDNMDNKDWMVDFFIRRGTYSCLIVLFWYNFCYDIFYVHWADKPDDNKMFNWMKGCGLAFSIIFGLANNIFSFIFKDILICFMNLIIYIGLLIYFYLYYSNAQLFEGENHKKGDGIVDIIIASISFCLLIFLIVYKLKNTLLEMNTSIRNSLGNIQKETNEIDIRVKNNTEEIKRIVCFVNDTPGENRIS